MDDLTKQAMIYAIRTTNARCDSMGSPECEKCTYSACGACDFRSRVCAYVEGACSRPTLKREGLEIIVSALIKEESGIEVDYNGAGNSVRLIDCGFDSLDVYTLMNRVEEVTGIKLDDPFSTNPAKSQIPGQYCTFKEFVDYCESCMKLYKNR